MADLAITKIQAVKAFVTNVAKIPAHQRDFLIQQADDGIRQIQEAKSVKKTKISDGAFEVFIKAETADEVASRVVKNITAGIENYMKPEILLVEKQVPVEVADVKLLAENKRLDSDNARLSAENINLKAELKTKSAEYKVLERKISDLTAEKNRLALELAAEQKKNADLRIEFKSKLDANLELEKKIAELKKQIKDLNVSLGQKEAELKNISDSKQRLINKIKELVDEKKRKAQLEVKAKGAIISLESEVKAKNLEIKTLTESIANLKTLADAKGLEIKNLDDKLAVSIKTIASKDADIAKYLDRIKELDGKIDDLKAELKDKDVQFNKAKLDLEAKNAILEKRLLDGKTQIDNYIADIGKLTAELKIISAEKLVCEKIKEEQDAKIKLDKAEYDKQIRQIETEYNDKLNASNLNYAADLAKGKAEYDAKLRIAQTELNVLKSTSAELKSANDALAELKKRHAEEIDRLTKEYNSKITELTNKFNAVNDGKFADLETKTRGLEAKMQTLTDLFTKLSAKKTELEAKNKQLLDISTKLVTERAILENSYKAEKDRLLADYKENYITKVQAKQDMLDMQNKLYTENEDAIKKHGDNMEQIIMDKLAAKDSEISNLNRELVKKSGEIKDLAGKLSTAEKTIDQKDKEIKTMTVKISNLEKQVADLQHGINEIESQIEYPVTGNINEIIVKIKNLKESNNTESYAKINEIVSDMEKFNNLVKNKVLEGLPEFDSQIETYIANLNRETAQFMNMASPNKDTDEKNTELQSSILKYIDLLRSVKSDNLQLLATNSLELGKKLEDYKTFLDAGEKKLIDSINSISKTVSEIDFQYSAIIIQHVKTSIEAVDLLVGKLDPVMDLLEKTDSNLVKKLYILSKVFDDADRQLLQNKTLTVKHMNILLEKLAKFNEVNFISQLIATLKNIAAELIDVRNSNEALTAKNAKLILDSTSVQELIDSKNKLSDEMQNLKASLLALRKQNESSSIVILNLKEQNKKLTDENRSISSISSAQQTEYASKIATYDRQIADLTSYYENSTATLKNELQSKLDQLAEQNKFLEEQNKKLTEQLDSLKEKSLEEEIKLTEQNQNLAGENSTLERDNSGLKNKINELTKLLLERTSILKDLNAKISAFKKVRRFITGSQPKAADAINAINDIKIDALNEVGIKGGNDRRRVTWGASEYRIITGDSYNMETAHNTNSVLETTGIVAVAGTMATAAWFGFYGLLIFAALALIFYLTYEIYNTQFKSKTKYESIDLNKPDIDVQN